MKISIQKNIVLGNELVNNTARYSFTYPTEVAMNYAF
jgi:hypothetical protein